jgi:cytochrome c oxidase subunit 1
MRGSRDAFSHRANWPTIGGLILLVSAILFIVILVRSQLGERQLSTPLRYALAVNPPKHVPASLNGFALWNAILLVLMVPPTAIRSASS